jgi:hypothetical protein
MVDFTKNFALLSGVASTKARSLDFGGELMELRAGMIKRSAGDRDSCNDKCKWRSIDWFHPLQMLCESLDIVFVRFRKQKPIDAMN